MTDQLTFRQLQNEQQAWANHNFPDTGGDSWQPFLGVVEEVGELSHALLKRKQGIRGTEWEHQLEIWDSVGDIVIYLADFCKREKIDFQDCVEETWQRVQKRDWQKDKLNGTNIPPTDYSGSSNCDSLGCTIKHPNYYLHWGGQVTGHAP
jgi:NTP pyrophosphatase (non-canonical NTP hydrolase)